LFQQVSTQTSYIRHESYKRYHEELTNAKKECNNSFAGAFEDMGEYYGSMLRSFYSKKVRSKPMLFLDYFIISY